MPPKYNVLWVEDSAKFELASVLGPFYASRRFDLTLAEDASSATEFLRTRRFDVIILDIRIPPGREDCWRTIYLDAGGDRTNAKLGLRILSWLFHDNHDERAFPERPGWDIHPRQIGVFSVEARLEVAGQLEGLGVGVFHEKRPGLPDTIVLDIVKEVLEQAGDAAVCN